MLDIDLRPTRPSEAAEDAIIDGIDGIERGVYFPTKPKLEPKPKKPKRDWHIKWREDEPKCGKHQWRTRDRYDVMNMRDLDNRHLGHCIRFATTMQQHASRLAGLLAERARREKKRGK